MNQKLLNVDWNVAKGKIENLKQQAVTQVATRANGAKSFLSDKLGNTRSAAIHRLTDRGIDLTRRQLGALERFKNRLKH